MLQISKKYNTFLDDMDSEGKLKLNRSEYKDVKSDIKKLAGYTQYSPWWVILMISVSLGLGTMVGWRRIVVTIGEKIGKSHLTYAQGASAELVAASTIGISTWLGLPVSTTHVLSSGVAGTMVAGKGLKNLRAKTVKSIAIAWLVTLPVTILLSGGLFLAMYYLIG
jgi:PiT family inorganic phosphate transporter